MRWLLLAASACALQPQSIEHPALQKLQPHRVEHPTLRKLAVGASVQAAGDVRIRRLSSKPSAFLLENVLTPTDCDRVAEAALASGMRPADTVSGDARSRTNCDVAWLAPPGQLSKDVAGLLLSDEARAAPDGGCEDLQVLRYADGGAYAPHHDTARDAPRALTVLYYLNGVGGTWFPLADDARDPPRGRAEALDRAGALDHRRDGVRVRDPKRGDALAFFNHDRDGGGLDWTAIHSALPCPGEKWVANHWFHVGGLFAELR